MTRLIPRLPALILLLSGLCAAGAAQAVDCKLSCQQAGCAVTPAANEPLRPSQWLLARQCEKLQVSAGAVELRYMHKNRWFAPPPQQPGRSLAELFSKFPPDQPCSVLSAACLQTAMAAKQAAVGGHGIDNRESRPAGEGKPCELGLPCGSVLPNDTEQLMLLTQPDLNASLHLRLARGTPLPGYRAELSLRFEEGRAVLGGGTLQPGSLYQYRLLDGDGRALASGEFSLLSSAMVQRLRQRAQQRVQQQGMDEALAWYDTLAENQLFWDALQSELRTSAP